MRETIDFICKWCGAHVPDLISHERTCDGIPQKMKVEDTKNPFNYMPMLVVDDQSRQSERYDFKAEQRELDRQSFIEAEQRKQELRRDNIDKPLSYVKTLISHIDKPLPNIGKPIHQTK